MLPITRLIQRLIWGIHRPTWGDWRSIEADLVCLRANLGLLDAKLRAQEAKLGRLKEILAPGKANPTPGNFMVSGGQVTHLEACFLISRIILFICIFSWLSMIHNFVSFKYIIWLKSGYFNELMKSYSWWTHFCPESCNWVLKNKVFSAILISQKADFGL